MTLLRLIERNISQRKLSSLLTALNVALGVMLVTAILGTRAELKDTYARQSKGYSLVIGPSGSPLQIVLNSVYHVDKSPGLIPLSLYQEYASEAKRKYVRVAVPYAVGDSYKGYRVVATTSDVFSHYFPHPESETTEGKFAAGRPFAYDPAMLAQAVEVMKQGGHIHLDRPEEAVLGYEVATKLGLKLEDVIEPTHGVEGGKEHDHKHEWSVVGVLKRTGTAIDRVVFVSLDSFYRIPEHAGGLDPITGEPSISAVLLFPRPGIAKPALLAELTKRKDCQVAEVATEVYNLMRIVGNVDRVFTLVAYMVIVIGVISVLVAIYNTMNERRRELAIMRAIGARRSTVLLSIVLEAMLLSLGGALAGILMGHLLLSLASGYLEAEAGLRLDPFKILPEEMLVVVAVTLAGALAGLIPAMKAYRTDVAKNLAPLS